MVAAELVGAISPRQSVCAFLTRQQRVPFFLQRQHQSFGKSYPLYWMRHLSTWQSRSALVQALNELDVS